MRRAVYQKRDNGDLLDLLAELKNMIHGIETDFVSAINDVSDYTQMFDENVDENKGPTEQPGTITPTDAENAKAAGEFLNELRDQLWKLANKTTDATTKYSNLMSKFEYYSEIGSKSRLMRRSRRRR
jgi:hypothetical protein